MLPVILTKTKKTKNMYYTAKTWTAPSKGCGFNITDPYGSQCDSVSGFASEEAAKKAAVQFVLALESLRNEQRRRKAQQPHTSTRYELVTSFDGDPLDGAPGTSRAPEIFVSQAQAYEYWLEHYCGRKPFDGICGIQKITSSIELVNLLDPAVDGPKAEGGVTL
jgi:hypothetical protein